MNTKTILFPTDFSSLSDAALEHATALAINIHARLLIVHVIEPGAIYGVGEMYYGVPDPDDFALWQMLSELKPPDPRVSCEYRMVKGAPAAEIVRLAEESGAEMIVMGTHGRTGLGRLLMGSVAEAVLHRATCPVLIIKSPHVRQPMTAAAT
ncbi:MAG TPA: universal stress protein [Pirellulales bacterium]|nr:universal stress protein [Pirellulales bacterium]